MHVAVTGASSGIGEAMARRWLERGAVVTMVARRKSLLDAIAGGAEGRGFAVAADLADPSQVTGWIDEAEARSGPIDVFVNNAGVQIVAPAVETAWADAQRLLQVDLLAPLALTMEVARRMIPRKAGTLVDVASMAAIAPMPGMYFYNAAKAGLAAASESLRAELKPHGIHVVTVYPGPVHSAMETAGRAAFEPSTALGLGPIGTAEVLAGLVERAVEKKRARVVYPAAYGAARHFPNVTRWAMDALTPPLKRGGERSS